MHSATHQISAEHFQRADGAVVVVTVQKHRRNGLGLSIAGNLMELMHGKMHLVVDGDLFKVVLEFDRCEFHKNIFVIK